VLPLPLTQIRATAPILANSFNRRRAVALTREQFRYGFANQDRTVPAVVTRAAFRRYRSSPPGTELLHVDRGHSLTIDSGWREVTRLTLDWLAAQGL